MKRRRQDPPNLPEQDPSTGSPGEGEPVFLAVGRLRRPHGIHGEILMDVLTGFPQRLHKGKTVFAGENHEPIIIDGIRGRNKEMILHFEGMQTSEEVGRLRNMIIYVKAADLPKLPEGEYYHHQLLGMSVVDEAGTPLGVLTDILETGANDVYVVKTPEDKELLLPVVDEVILEVNPEQRQMRVRPPEWR